MQGAVQGHADGWGGAAAGSGDPTSTGTEASLGRKRGSVVFPLNCWEPPRLPRLTQCCTSGRTQVSLLHGKFQVCTDTVCP